MSFVRICENLVKNGIDQIISMRFLSNLSSIFCLWLFIIGALFLLHPQICLLSFFVASKEADSSTKGQALVSHTAISHEHKHGIRRRRIHILMPAHRKTKKIKLIQVYRLLNQIEHLKTSHCCSIFLVQFQAHFWDLAFLNLEMMKHVICDSCI